MSAARLASATEHLRALVAFDSTSRNSNLPIIDYIESVLAPLGFSCLRVPSPDGRKCNLLARLGPAVDGGMVLSGHTDVVPVDGQPWLSDPFTLTEKDGALYGRGTCDMKGFVACLLAMAPLYASRSRRTPLSLAFSYDEEVGCLGIPHLLRHLQEQRLPMPSLAVVGEPTLMQVATAHKGVLSFETTVLGKEAHSSQPHLGVNSLHIACSLVHFLTQLGEEVAQAGPFDARFEPPYSTLHVGIIEGGTARNIIARQCRFVWEIRPLPGIDPEIWLARFETHCEALRCGMRARHAEADIITRPMSRMMGVTLPARAQGELATVMRAAQTNHDIAVAFATEAGVFNAYGIPSIICGPGSIDQAHQPNEFVAISQLEQCLAFLQRLDEEAA